MIAVLLILSGIVIGAAAAICAFAYILRDMGPRF